MKKESGFALIESLLIIVTVAAMVFLLANLPNSFNLINKSRHVSLAKEIILKQIEDKRSTSYLNLTAPATYAITPAVDSRISLLPSGSGTVTVSNCDPQICTHAEDIKSISVSVSWKDNAKNQQVTLQTFIGSGGLDQ